MLSKQDTLNTVAREECQQYYPFFVSKGLSQCNIQFKCTLD